MVNLSQKLELDRCPYCQIDKPNLHMVWQFNTKNHKGGNPRGWRIYLCNGCGGLVTAASANFDLPVHEVYPRLREIDEDLPERAKEYLKQAIASVHAPAGAVMLAASSVDAMLKEKKYTEGSLYSRIKKAVSDHLITREMEKWAHEVRLDANDQRHADKATSLPEKKDAEKVIEFTTALGMFLFVLPARVKRGVEGSETPE